MYIAMIDNQSDKEIFKKIVITYEKQFLLYANSILHNYSLSEEAVSESLLRLAGNFQKVHNFEVSKIVAYTVIIIRNVCNNIIRAEEKQKTLPEEYTLDKEGSVETDEFIIYTYYNLDKTKSILFEQQTYDSFKSNIDNERTGLITKTDKYGQEIMVYSTDDIGVLFIWDNGEYVFNLSADMSEEELMKIYYSVK